MMKTILFVGGGSIGHIAPGIAVAQELKKNVDAACMFVCGANAGEADFIKKYAFPYATLPHIRRYPIRALMQSYRILSTQKPDLIFSKGSYVSLPLCLVAWAKKIPVILHESDAIMGRANRLLSKVAHHICLGYSTFDVPHSTFTGNPVRDEITKGSRGEGLKITKFSGKKPILLVLGGSQGAKTLNEIVWNNLENILELVDIAHITGPGKMSNVEQRISPLGRELGPNRNVEGYWSTEFAYDELPHLYAIADIALSRAGANTLAELDANGIPTILVPLRGVGHDHQYQNAKVMAEQNPLFIHMEQEELKKKLMTMIHMILKKPATSPLDTPPPRVIPSDFSKKNRIEGRGGGTQDDTDSAASKITKVILEHLESSAPHP